MTRTFQFNPYTGKPRHPSDIKSDPEGILILEPGAPLMAAVPAVQPVMAGTVEPVVVCYQNPHNSNSFSKFFYDMPGAIPLGRILAAPVAPVTERDTQDGQRYRWIRDNAKREFTSHFHTPDDDSSSECQFHHTTTFIGPRSEVFDAMVDAAIAAAPAPQGQEVAPVPSTDAGEK